MNRTSLAILSILGLALAAAPADAFVSQRIEANIPFKFVVQDTTFPAGKYVIEPVGSIDSSALKIEKADGGKAVVVLTKNASAGNISDTPQLIFNRHGRSRVLHRIYAAGSDVGAEIVQAPAEQRTARVANGARSPRMARHGNTPSNRKPLANRK